MPRVLSQKDIKGSCHRRIHVEQPHHTDLMKRVNLHGNDYYNVNEMHTWNMEYQRFSRVVLLKSLSEFYASLNSVECYSWSDLISFIREKRSETTFSVCIFNSSVCNNAKPLETSRESVKFDSNRNKLSIYEQILRISASVSWTRAIRLKPGRKLRKCLQNEITHFSVVIIIMNIHALARNIFWGLST